MAREVSEITLDKCPVDEEIIGMVAIGSHVWNMNHENSDVDSMAFVVEPTSRILRGQAKYQTKSVFRSETDHGWPIDIHVHEVGRAVHFAEKGNINFMTGILSPIATFETPEFLDLRSRVLSQPTAEIFYSIHGMADGNVKRYYQSDKEKMLPHRAAKLLKGVEFGIRYLETCGAVQFCPPSQYDFTLLGVQEAMKDLEAAYENTYLPKKYEDTEDPDLLRDWLEDVRIKRLR